MTVAVMTKPPREETYRATWTNVHGEQLDYEARRGEKVGHLRHSGISDQALEVRGALVTNYSLDREELTFLSLCWSASAPLRHLPVDGTPDYKEVWRVISEEPGSYVGVTLVTEFDRCQNCSQPIGRDFLGGWYHLSHERHFTYVGCRAASSITGPGWDETLRKTWKATPRSVPPAGR